MKLVDAIEMQLAAPQPESTVWREHVHKPVDELDALPVAPYDRLRFGGPVSATG